MATTKTIEIRTAIPGPRSQAILERKQRVIANAKTVVLPIVAQEGRGATLTDVDGNTFIDFTGGVGCLNTGHSHPRVVEAAPSSFSRFAHTDFTVVPYGALRRAGRAAARAALPFAAPRSRLLQTVPEADRDAVKFARSDQRPAVIAFERRLPRRTLLSMTLTSRRIRQARDGPAGAEVYRAPFQSEYRAPNEDALAGSSAQMFPTHVAAEQVAPIIVEPVQGEGRVPSRADDVPRRATAICDDHGICLIADEVQTGFAPHRQALRDRALGVSPDLITIAKSIAGGSALLGVLGGRDHRRRHDGAVGGPYIRNPGRAGGSARRPRRDRGGEPERARIQIGETMRARMLGLAGALRAHRRRAAVGACSRSSSSSTAPRSSRRRCWRRT